MPSKPSTKTKLPDIKARKLTDFWGKTDAGSSPQASLQTTSQRTQTSSPLRKPTTNTSTPVSKQRPGAGLFPENSKMGNLTSRAGLAFNNDLQPTPSSRKFIVISDDEEEPETESKMSVSKKRPRESAPPPPPAFSPPSATYQSTPEASSGPIIDLTRSPPRKKHITEALANGSHSRTASSTFSGYSSHPEFSPITPLSPQDSRLESVDAAITSSSASTSYASIAHQPSASFSVADTSIDSILPSPILPQPLEQKPEDRARSRIEEIRRLAEERRRAEQEQAGAVFRPIVIEDSSEEEDLLEKLAPTKKVQPAARKVDATREAPASTFDASSPPTGPDSDDDSIAEPPSRPNVTTRSRSRAASQAPVLPPPPTKSRASSKAPTRTPAAGSRSRASSKPPVLAPPPARPKKVPVKVVTTPTLNTIPSSLASLLADSPTSNRRRNDPETISLMKAVQRDMKEMEQRHLYGGAPDLDSLEDSRHINPSVTEMALGEEDGRKMNEVLAMDNVPASQVSPWRPFWDEQLVGAGNMDVEYQIPPLLLSNNPHPILAHLQSVASNRHYTHLGALLNSGILLVVPANNDDESLIPWLFKLSCEAPENIAISAQHTFHARLSSITNAVASRPHLAFCYIMDVALSLGPLVEAIAPLGRTNGPISGPRDPMTRNVVLTRLLSTIKKDSTAMTTESPEEIILLLLLLYLDPSTPNDVRRDISLIVEDITLSLAISPVASENLKLLVICKKVIEATFSFRLSEKRMLLDCIFGGQPGPRRFMRWIATGLLLPDVVKDLEWAGYLQQPPLGPFAEMLTPSRMFTSPFRIYLKTDYYDLHHRVDILGTILTDVELYGSKEDSNIERIVAGLDHVHGKIVDARAAFIERTQAKDALQRLRLRVHFQFQRTVKPTATIEKMLKR